jgi:hypothetical protein
MNKKHKIRVETWVNLIKLNNTWTRDYKIKVIK